MATSRLSSRGSRRYFHLITACYYANFLLTHSTREEAMALIHLYYKQVTQGCGQDDCENDVCASNKRFKRQLSNDEAAAKAISLFKKQSKLCVPNNVKETSLTSGVKEVGEDEEHLATPVQETSGCSVRDGVNVLYFHHSGAKGVVNVPGKQASQLLSCVLCMSELVCVCSL